MLPRLLILSDLWGHRRSQWVSHYKERFSPYFDVHFYDSTLLAGIDPAISTEKELHQAFVEGGIDRVVDRLLEKGLKPAVVIACSVGGVIAWRAALKGMHMPHLIAISATRLRYEIKIPDTTIELFYGGLDEYRPDGEWEKRVGLVCNVLQGQGHQIYTEAMNVDLFVKSLDY